jgi:hypothetical protein
LEDVYDDLHKMNVKGSGGKTKNREEWRRMFRRPKLILSCSTEGKEGYIKNGGESAVIE